MSHTRYIPDGELIAFAGSAIMELPETPPLLCFDANVLTASAMAEQGEPLVLAWTREGRIVMAQSFIRRPIISTAGCYDLISPFEYGILYLAPSAKPSELGFFCKAKEEICRQEGIVSEFYRHSPFSPVLPPEAVQLDAHYYLDLRPDFGQWRQTWNNSTRRGVRRALEQQWQFVVHTGRSGDIERFVALYHAAMTRRDAKRFYFFSSHYLRALLGCRDRVFLCFLESRGGDLVAGSIVMGDGMDYYHLLTAAAEEHLPFRPNERMLVELYRFCQSRGGERLLLGGGDMGVKAFKARFSQWTLPYHVTRRVYREKVYQQLCVERANGSGFFPAYRQGDSAYQTVSA